MLQITTQSSSKKLITSHSNHNIELLFNDILFQSKNLNSEASKKVFWFNIFLRFLPKVSLHRASLRVLLEIAVSLELRLSVHFKRVSSIQFISVIYFWNNLWLQSLRFRRCQWWNFLERNLFPVSSDAYVRIELNGQQNMNKTQHNIRKNCI